MMDDVVEVEVNMIASWKLKQRTDNEKKKDQPSTSEHTDVRLETMMKTMEKFFEKLAIDNRPPCRQQPDPRNMNQNFRRPPPQQNLQILQRENRN